mgnify:CR=1 FL=1
MRWALVVRTAAPRVRVVVARRRTRAVPVPSWALEWPNRIQHQRHQRHLHSRHSHNSSSSGSSSSNSHPQCRLLQHARRKFRIMRLQHHTSSGSNSHNHHHRRRRRHTSVIIIIIINNNSNNNKHPHPACRLLAPLHNHQSYLRAHHLEPSPTKRLPCVTVEGEGVVVVVVLVAAVTARLRLTVLPEPGLDQTLRLRSGCGRRHNDTHLTMIAPGVAVLLLRLTSLAGPVW